MDRFCDLPTGFRLCYRTHGHPGGEPLLLIAGLGLQLTYWSPLITEDLVRRGYRVITMDNRDVGRSSRGKGKPPGLLRMMRHIGSTGHFVDEQSLRSYAEQAWDRGNGASAHEGMARQVGAIMKSGDRTARLRGVRAPTLVIHGDQDLMVAPSGGQATADAIPGAVHLTVRGMGHDLPDAVIPYLVDLIDGHAERHSEALNPSSLTLARQA